MLSLVLTAGVLAVCSGKTQAASFAGNDINPFAEMDSEYKASLKASLSSEPDTGEAGAAEQTVLSAAQSGSSRYVMEFTPACSYQTIYDLIKGYDFDIIGKSSNRTFAIDSDKDLAAVHLEFDPYCEYIEKDIDFSGGAVSSISFPDIRNKDGSELSLTPNDPYFIAQWYLSSLNVPAAWDLTTGSADIYVAVIDSGIDRSQPDLAGADIRDGMDIVNGGSVNTDVSGHGTNVTGIIAATMNNNEGIAGISSGVAIIPICIENVTGSILSSSLATAIYAAADMNCKVMNISLGGGYTRSVEDAVAYAYGKGCIIVASAGNDGNSAKNYPASYNGVISVGSSDQTNSRSYFSNYNSMLDVVAPGEDIYTTDDSGYTGQNYGYHDGTSFSSPCVAAVAALAVSRDPALSPDSFSNLLHSTCTDLGTVGFDDYTGYGLVNAALLLQNIAFIPVVTYQSHVQDIGWQGWVNNGEISGTSGQSKRLEAMNIKLVNVSGGIEYRTHVQDIGWMDWVADGALSGTSGQSKRLEAIQIRLTGAAAEQYDVYYRVHAQNNGWLDWAKNGESSGTAGFGYRLEAIQIVLVSKGGAAPGATARAYVDYYAQPVVSYQTHVQDLGWQAYVSNGMVSGTSGQSKRLEAIHIKLENIAGGIEYRTQVQDIGWMDWAENDALSGTSGQSKRLEAIEIRLTGAAAEQYDVYYRVHAQNNGWLDWAENGQSAGTSGYSYRLEAIQVVLVSKGGAAPGLTVRPYIQA